MWHEARRQERKIRKAIVDYKKRSERRHQYYERIKQDPTKFLQVHGRKCKIHLDGVVATEADNNNHMMPWQGDSNNMIDRFDARTHLDFIQETNNNHEETVTSEDKKCNFERYRVLIWNEYKKISEHTHLRQIYVDEQFPEMSAQQKHGSDSQKQLLAQTRASIGYDYEENSSPWKGSAQYSNRGRAADDYSDDDDFDIAQELEEIPPLSEISMDAITAMDEIGAKKFKLAKGGFGSCLVDDQNHMDKVSAAKDIESERRRFSGRKSRRERRQIKDERLKGREIGALSYVRQESSDGSDSSDSESSSSSDSSSSEDRGGSHSSNSKNKIEYITSFGEDTTPKKSQKVESTRKNSSKRRKRSKSRSYSPKRKHYRSRSRSPLRHTKYSGYSRRRSRSHDRSYRYRRSDERRSSSSHSSSSDSSHSRERRKSSDHRSKDSKYRTQDATAKITSSQQSTDSLIKSLSQHKSAEEKAAAIKKLTPQQKLKIKMQRALNKQLKVDRHADKEKKMEKQQQLIEREDDLREISKRIRRRDGGLDEVSMYD